MPTSFPENISRIITLIMEIKPFSILDVGSGFGKYGYLCREYLDVVQGRFQKEDWKVRIDGIEGFPPYLSDLQRFIYNRLIEGDIFANLAVFKDQSYDLALAIDVLEHFEKEKGLQFLQECQRVARVVLVSVPVGYPQGALFGNPLEAHRAEWTKKDFQRLNAPLVLKGYQSWIALLSQNFPENLNYLRKIRLIEFKENLKRELKRKLGFKP
jgi:SAM-dependent methyltransferase